MADDRTQVAPKYLESYEEIDDYTLQLTFENASDQRRMIDAIEQEYGAQEPVIEEPVTTEHKWATIEEVHLMNIGSPSKRYPEVLAAPSPDMSAQYSDDAVRTGFGSHKDWGLENIVVIPDSDGNILEVLYPEGTSAPSDNGKGGAGFYAEYDKLKGSESAVLRYDIRFPSDFEWVKGGKLPGLYGGNAPSGGMSAEDGFTTRMMWRTDGDGEIYLYVINKDNPYGQSVGRGLFHWPRGRWVTIEQEIVLNDPGAANGIARIWIDGSPVFEVVDVVYRNRTDITIDGLMFSTFFGGSSEEWRTPRDQIAEFRNFKILGSIK